jgi:hypothetical protein
MMFALEFKCPTYPNESKFCGIYETREDAEKARDYRIEIYRSMGLDTNNCRETSYYITECELNEYIF